MHSKNYSEPHLVADAVLQGANLRLFNITGVARRINEPHAGYGILGVPYY